MRGVHNLLFPPDNRGVAGLFFFGWRGMIVAILAGLAASFLLCGYWYPYWRLADMDLMMAYQGFLVNSGHPQDFFDHPGHLSVILTSAWFELFHKLGWIDALTLSDIPPASDAVAFDRVWTQAVRAGRLLSLTLATGFIVAFALLLRRLIRDWQIAVMAAFCLAFSGGLMMNARTFRTDMIAAGLVTCGFLIALIAARSPRLSVRPVLIGIAAMLFTLGIINKVNALFLATGLVAVIPLFGMASGEMPSFWRSGKAFGAVLGFAVVAALLAIPAGQLVVLGLSSPAAMPPPFGVHGLYQALIAGLIVAAMAVYARLWRVSVAEALAAMLAVVAGISLGLLALDILYHPRNVAIVMNPIEHMFAWARGSDPTLGTAGTILSGRLFVSLGQGLLEIMAQRTFVLHSSGRPTIVLDWLVVAGMVLAWRRGERRLVFQVLALMMVAWAVDVTSTLRGLKLEYFIHADPLIIIAAAWLLAHLPDLKTHRFAYAVAVGVVAVHVVLSQAAPLKHVLRKVGPEGECVWLPDYAKRIERFSFCPPQAKRG